MFGPPNTSWGSAFWGSFHTSSKGMTGGFWKTRVMDPPILPCYKRGCCILYTFYIHPLLQNIAIVKLLKNLQISGKKNTATCHCYQKRGDIQGAFKTANFRSHPKTAANIAPRFFSEAAELVEASSNSPRVSGLIFGAPVQHRWHREETDFPLKASVGKKPQVSQGGDQKPVPSRVK